MAAVSVSRAVDAEARILAKIVKFIIFSQIFSITSEYILNDGTKSRNYNILATASISTNPKRAIINVISPVCEFSD